MYQIPRKPASFKSPEHYSAWRNAVHAAHDAIAGIGRAAGVVGRVIGAIPGNVIGNDIRKILKK